MLQFPGEKSAVAKDTILLKKKNVVRKSPLEWI